MFEQKKLLYHHYKEAHSELKCQLKVNGQNEKSNLQVSDELFL